MKLKLLRTFVLLAAFFIAKAGQAHDFYMSLYKLNYMPQEQSLYITVKVFTDDYEQALLNKYGQNLFLIKPENLALKDSLIQDYALSTLSLKIEGEAREISFVGWEVDEIDAMTTWVYLEVPNTQLFKELEVRCTNLLAEFQTQKNTFFIDNGLADKALMLDRGETSGKVVLNE